MIDNNSDGVGAIAFESGSTVVLQKLQKPNSVILPLFITFAQLKTAKIL